MERSPFHEAWKAIETQYVEAAKRARQAKAVQVSIPPMGEPPSVARLAREPQIRNLIDEVCIEFAKTRKIRRLDPDDAVFLLDRFDHAYELCGWAHRNGIQFPGKSTADLLRLFLVEFWFYSGHLRWSSGWRGALF